MATRKKGLGNVSKETIEKLASKGASPVEVMVLTMRKLYDRANLCAELGEFATSDAERDKYSKEGADCLLQACEIAKDVAPYFHPRLASVEHKGDEDNPIGLELTSVSELRKLLRGGSPPADPKPAG
jgi:hypothetical protein